MRILFRNGVVYHGQIVTRVEPCNSMIINQDQIEYLGNDPANYLSSLNEGDKNLTVVDLNGLKVFPAFIDGHMHLLQFGASLVKVNLGHCKNLQEIRQTITVAAHKMPNAKRILCRGWRQVSTNREALASMIDGIDDRPIFIDADDLHSEWCSSAALREMGITRSTPEPVGGTIHRDENGEPTGLISEAAVLTIIWPHLVGVMSREEKLNCMLAAIKEYHSAGYVSVVEMAMDSGSWELLEYLHSKQKLNLRIAAHWLITPSDNDAGNVAQVQQAIRLHKRYNIDKSPDFRIAGIKVICDGVIDSCTAALSKPYLVSPNGTGDLIWSASTLRTVALKADEAQLQIALHAIGDAAIHIAINTLENLGTSGRRHRIEHLELTHPEDAKRLGKLGITASIQPAHSDPAGLGEWPKLIGADRCDWAFAHRSFYDNGAQLAVGTDVPTAPYSPFPNMFVANTRTSSRDLSNHTKINKLPPLELSQVWSAATWGSAYSCFAEKITGSLEVGKKADFIIVDGLSQGLDAESLLRAEVLETWMNGKRVYRKRMAAL